MNIIMNRLNELCVIADERKPVFKTQMAASIYIRNKHIVTEHNSYKTHPFQARFGSHRDCIYLHAETNAIKEALKKIEVNDLKKATMYVARMKWKDYNRTKKVQGLAKPCEGCQRALATFGVEEVFYTLDDDGYDML